MSNLLSGKTAFLGLLSLLLLGLLACSEHEHADGGHEHTAHMRDTEASVTLAKDAESHVTWNKFCPVTGKEVSTEAATVEYQGKAIGFCCPGCDKTFEKDPDKNVNKLSADGSEFIGG